MRVIHYYPTWLPLTQTWMYNQVRFLPASVEQHIVCEHTSNLHEFGVPNIHSHADGSRLGAAAERVRQKFAVRSDHNFLARVARELRADVIHSHFGNVAWANLPAVRSAGARHVVTFYGMDVNHLPRRDARWRDRYAELFGSSDLVLCEGPHMAAAVEALGCPADKLRVHHLGVDVENIAFRPRAWRPGEPLRVLIAATFQQKKGIPYALEALSILKETLPVEITVIGEATSEARSRLERREIYSSLRRFGLDGVTRMRGFVSYDVLLQEAYRNHVFLAPSVVAEDGDTEGGAPVTIIEMAASGMPIISTLHGDIPEVIRNGRSGLLAAERDAPGLAVCLRWLASNPDQWIDLATAARERVEAEFNGRLQGEKLAGLYRQTHPPRIGADAGSPDRAALRS